MKKIVRLLKTNRTSLLQMIIAAGLFFAAALPFRRFMALLPGVTEIRPANAIPPVLGLLWGTPAALGIAAGNLISDILTGNSAYICIAGFFTNYLYAYLPHLLWYRLWNDQEHPEPSFANVRQVIRYIGIMLINALIISAMLALIFQCAGLADIRDSYLLFFYNNFNYAVILGIPLLILVRRISPWETVTGSKTEFPIRTKVILGFLMIAVLFLAFTGIVAWQAKGGYESSLDHWMFIYQVLAASIYLIFAVTIAFLWYVETRFVHALELLTEHARRFAGQERNDGALQVSHLEIDTKDEVQSLAESMNHMMDDIADYVTDLKIVTAEKERIGAELEVASRIQSSMLPCIFPPYPDRDEFDIAASMKPAREVGGDFYDFFLIDEDHLCLIMADVSGKGIPAALFMVVTKTLLKNVAQLGETPGKVLETVNEQLCAGNDEDMFVTVFLGMLEISTGIFRYANAGHNPPCLIRRREEPAWLAVHPGFVLAGMPGTGFREQEIRMEPGDFLFLYTDGVTEAENEKQELFGEMRLLQCLQQCQQDTVRGAGELLAATEQEMQRFTGTAEQTDDITMLALYLCGRRRR